MTANTTGANDESAIVKNNPFKKDAVNRLLE
jgi:hypothetical protein